MPTTGRKYLSSERTLLSPDLDDWLADDHRVKMVREPLPGIAAIPFSCSDDRRRRRGQLHTYIAAEPGLSLRPMTTSLNSLSAVALFIVTFGMSTRTLNPSRCLTKQRKGLA